MLHLPCHSKWWESASMDALRQELGIVTATADWCAYGVEQQGQLVDTQTCMASSNEHLLARLVRKRRSGGTIMQVVGLLKYTTKSTTPTLTSITQSPSNGYRCNQGVEANPRCYFVHRFTVRGRPTRKREGECRSANASNTRPSGSGDAV